MLRYDKLTVKAQEALQAAQDIAEKNGQQQLEPLHLLAALVAQQRRRRASAAQPLGRAPGSALRRDRKRKLRACPR